MERPILNSVTTLESDINNVQKGGGGSGGWRGGGGGVGKLIVGGPPIQKVGDL